jgi:hypothetical protein
MMRDTAGKGTEGSPSNQGQPQGEPGGQGKAEQRTAKSGSRQQQSPGPGNKPGSQGQANQGASKGGSGQGNRQGNQGQSGQDSSKKSTGQGDKTDNEGNQGAERSSGDAAQGNQRDGQGNQRDSQSRSGQEGPRNEARQEKRTDNQDRSGQNTGQRDADQTESRSGTARQREREASNNNQRSESGNTPQPPRRLVPQMPDFVSWLSPVLKWIVYAILALVGIYVLIRVLANFSSWARRLLTSLQNLWQNWFGRRSPRARTEGDAAAEGGFRPPPRPFSAFANPFANGTAGDFAPDELVCYSFEALEAWARERGMGRRQEETPIEFAERLGGRLPALEAPASRLALLYARVAYSQGALPAASVEFVRQLWQKLTPASLEVATAAAGG